ncbi:hypothetical protein DN069_34925 [Streptacidiphilus pinicola]|uniref:Uncharacterized protein n=1 Tax=Streptacidiphilus pinicola TaxID=2219663 RepID=A0A2X0J142_9ACTN|nr:hypothetical protein [Streptacidiphilus pinicola]RAG81048.1 hypothetical protein DN069_34925 [Streptacidiphilus pinicola]
MAAGGEERAAVLALKQKVQQALPKIAERNAHVVDDAVDKGSRNLAEHADNEVRTTDSFRSKMPQDKPVPTPRTTPGSKIDQALGGGDATAARASGDLAAPQFGRDTLRDSRNFDEQIDHEMSARGLDRAEHDRLRVSRTNDLTDEQVQEVVDVRNSITLEDGQMITKVLHPDVAKAYVNNLKKMPNGDAFFHDRFGGSIARGTDTADLATPAQLRDGLALDDKGVGWTPVPEGASEAYQLRLHAPEGLKADTTFGAVDDQAAADRVAQAAGQTTGRAWKDPFTGTGYTGGGVPEWQASGTEFGGRAEIWKMTPDGGETMVGFFDRGRWTNLGL